MARDEFDAALLREMAAFAPDLVRNRMIGFEKDIGICLTSVRHPTEPKPTVAYFPALGLCCATLDYLSSLFSGRIENGPHVSSIVSYAERYLPETYNEDVIRVLVNALRHSIAHRGIADRVWLEKHKGRPGRRICWTVYKRDRAPAIQIVTESGEVSGSPWPCRYTHRVHVHLGRLWKDVKASAIAYAAELPDNPRLLRNFTKCMRNLYPE